MNKRRKDFFFKKKKQKTFAPGAGPLGANPLAARYPKEARVFWFFFSKKNNLPSGHQRRDKRAALRTKRFSIYQTNNSNPGQCQVNSGTTSSISFTEFGLSATGGLVSVQPGSVAW